MWPVTFYLACDACAPSLHEKHTCYLNRQSFCVTFALPSASWISTPHFFFHFEHGMEQILSTCILYLDLLILVPTSVLEFLLKDVDFWILYPSSNFCGAFQSVLICRKLWDSFIYCIMMSFSGTPKTCLSPCPCFHIQHIAPFIVSFQSHLNLVDGQWLLHWRF